MDTPLCPYKLASEGLVRYVGDKNLLGHGGAWIDISTWSSDEYASCVRLTISDDGPSDGTLVYVEKLVINKPNNMSKVWECCGEPSHDPLVQADACLFYGCYDPDDSDWREPHSFTLVIPDDAAKYDDFLPYARIHDATVSTREELEQLLREMVGKQLYNGRM